MSMTIVAVTGLNAMQQVQQGRYAQGVANLQADQQEYQGRMEEAQALQTAQIIRRAGKRAVGAANAGYAGAGVAVGEGSALETERQIDVDVERDAYQAILSGQRRAIGLNADAEMGRADGRARAAAGYVNAVGTVIAGAGSAMRATGWRTGGPGFSGQQAPAPVVDRSFRSRD